MNPSRLRMVAVIAGLVVGCTVAALLVATGLLSRPSEPRPETVGEFLDAYRRSRAGTFVVDAEFTRTLADGRQLTSPAVVAQRPPDRVRRQLGSASGRLGDETLNCSTPPDAVFQCAPGGELAPFDEEVLADVDAMRTYVEGNPPAYSVTDAGRGCFELRRQTVLLEPPYGDYARMCFDATTGAVSYLEVRLPGGTSDVMQALSVRGEVRDSDLAIQADDRFAPTIQDPE